MNLCFHPYDPDGNNAGFRLLAPYPSEYKLVKNQIGSFFWLSILPGNQMTLPLPCLEKRDISWDFILPPIPGSPPQLLILPATNHFKVSYTFPCFESDDIHSGWHSCCIPQEAMLSCFCFSFGNHSGLPSVQVKDDQADVLA